MINFWSHLLIDRLLTLGGSATVSAAVLLTGPGWRVTVRGFEERTGTRRVMLGRFAGGVASRQRRRVLTRGRRDRLPALYQLDDLIGFPGKIAVWPERVVPAAVRAEVKRYCQCSPVSRLYEKFSHTQNNPVRVYFLFKFKKLSR